MQLVVLLHMYLMHLLLQQQLLQTTWASPSLTQGGLREKRRERGVCIEDLLRDLSVRARPSVSVAAGNRILSLICLSLPLCLSPPVSPFSGGPKPPSFF